MSVGSNIEYGNSKRLLMLAMEKLFMVCEDNDGDASNRPAGKKTFGGKICMKSGSDTGPQDDTADDFPNALGDVCVHFDSNGDYAGLYVATAGDLSSTCTWTQID